MDLLANLALGFQTAVSPMNLVYCLAGTLIGTLIGVLPGIGPVQTLAILMPTTFALPPVSALIMLSGIYYGAQYGGSTTSILVNVPGEASSVVTCLDGYQMALQGRAGAALTVSALGSFFAGCFATLVLAVLAVPLAEVAFKFGPAEYFSLMVFGLIGSIVLASGSTIKAVGMIILGLLLGMVGTDVTSGAQRFAFGIPELADGIGFVSLAMGLFGICDIINSLEKQEKREILRNRVQPAVADAAGVQGGRTGRGARDPVRVAARDPAGRRGDPLLVHRLHAREEELAAPRDASGRGTSAGSPPRRPPTTPPPRPPSSRC